MESNLHRVIDEVCVKADKLDVQLRNSFPEVSVATIKEAHLFGLREFIADSNFTMIRFPVQVR
jgi:hypothetical protein